MRPWRWLRAALATLMALATVLVPGLAAAAAVVVIPLEPRNVPPTQAAEATEVIRTVIRGTPKLELVETEAVERRLGVDLAQQARSCEYDTFCLVEVGEILGSQRMLVGHIQRTGKGDAGPVELKLFVLDVEKSTVVEVLVWRISGAPGSVDAAVRAAAMRLFAAPDATVVLDVSPASADVELYGERLNRPKGRSFPFWSGVYEVQVAGEGLRPKGTRFEVRPSEEAHLQVELEPDLEASQRPRGRSRAQPFKQSSRREGGSGVTSEEVGAVPEGTAPPVPSAFLNPVAWTLTGVGAVAAVIGAGIAGSAQGDYDSLSGQLRFVPGMTVAATDAAQMREADRSRFLVGSRIGVAGAVIAASGLAWMLVDAALRLTASPVEVGTGVGTDATGRSETRGEGAR